MKKKDVAEIIGRLTDLEVKMARHTCFQEVASSSDLIIWFTELNKITSDLDKIYKGK